jgi:hypothetical protein
MGVSAFIILHIINSNATCYFLCVLFQTHSHGGLGQGEIGIGDSFNVKDEQVLRGHAADVWAI